ncbi:response regulator [Brevundimonas sp. SGAir0440]|uniref:response regulator n=1 Tax=Brevundimonas sp. SGAir0440 TaxID=2579977 RepID=UPI001FEF0056|nr:response regulator [Brevundimonas sp. SGAir0440]
MLLDIGLPDMDGYEVKARLGVDPLTRHVPVLALTAAVSAPDRARGRASGFDAWLAKPLDLAALAAALNTALNTALGGPEVDADGRERA